jgi:hypothetical protein
MDKGTNNVLSVYYYLAKLQTKNIDIQAGFSISKVLEETREIKNNKKI